MIQPATLPWFARHEIGLVWRDWIGMMTAGRRRRGVLMVTGFTVIAFFIHLFAFGALKPVAATGIFPDKQTLVVLTGCLILAGSMMLSQAMESVTRAFYTRADLDLILSSPAPARRVFAIRIGAIALSTTAMSLLLASPFINVLVLVDSPRWFAAYGVIASIGAVSTAIAVVLTVLLFRVIGPRRTRLIAQVLAAIIGAAFVIGIQVAAILSFGSLSRLTILRSDGLVAGAPDLSSLVWLPARAAMGETGALVATMIVGLLVLALVIVTFSARFGDHVLAASSIGLGAGAQTHRASPFRGGSTKGVLRRKEWALLRRDPWLVSQSLMQVLYLLPPALLLWRNFGSDVGSLLILVPVVVMAAGQLGGGLAWLAISGEDAPDLVATAPIPPRKIILAKIESVLIAVFAVALPLVVALAVVSPRYAVCALFGIAVSAGSATMIQIWFRAQARRSQFRRRHTSSRVATFAEAFASILWAGTATIAAAGSWVAIGPALFALLILGATRLIRPRPAV